MTKRNRRLMMIIVGLLLVVLVLVMFTSTGQDAQEKLSNEWKRFSSETNTSSPKPAKVVAQKPPGEKKKTVNEVLKELSQPKEPTANVGREMTEAEKAFMFDTPETGAETVVAVVKQPPASTAVVTTKAVASAPVPKVTVVAVKPPVIAASQATIAAVKPTVVVTPRVSVPKSVRTVRRIPSKPTQMLAVSPARQNPPVVVRSPSPKPLQPEALAQKQVQQIVIPITSSRDSRWNAVCEDLHGFGVPPTVQCQ